MKIRISQHLLLLFLAVLFYSSCEKCDDCGPSKREPYVKVRFFNIDSLVKVDARLSLLEDSLATINQMILDGDTTLVGSRDQLGQEIRKFNEVKETINEGRIRIDEIYGANGEGPLVFRDSTTNDSLTVFRFPLDMNKERSLFIIHLDDRTDELELAYERAPVEANDLILMEISGLHLISTTYDSAYIQCPGQECVSNETTVKIYF